jgi:hypothetical protein
MINFTGLEECRRLIETSLGWGDAASWTNEDFDNLSERIFEKTSVRLSVSTLKRLWGKVKYDHSPTTATLNALARYAGFENWRAAAAATSAASADGGKSLAPADAEGIVPNSQSPTINHPAQNQQPVPRQSRSTTPLVIATIALTVLLSLLSARFHPPAPTPVLRFESRQTSDELPNSVVFDYDATPLHPHDVMIQQNWDIRRREKVDPNGKQHTSIYYYPGYFSAKLVVDGEIRKESDVFIKTKGWKGIVGRSPLPIYLSPQEIRTDSGHLGIDAATLAAKTGSGIFTNTWVTFANVRPFPGISGDHFTLTTTLRNTSTVEQCLCRNVRITLLGTIAAIVIPLSDKGCIASLTLLTGSGAVNGKDHDLSAFGLDFSNWQKITCTEADHMMKITIGDHPPFTVPDVQSIGDIVGLRIVFEGTGVIREAVLQGNAQPVSLLSGTPYR